MHYNISTHAMNTKRLLDHLGIKVTDIVTHSMGGIILRHLRDPRLTWSRAVMLAPPNQGSRLAAGLVRNPLFRWFYGPAGSELRSAFGYRLRRRGSGVGPPRALDVSRGGVEPFPRGNEPRQRCSLH